MENEKRALLLDSRSARRLSVLSDEEGQFNIEIALFLVGIGCLVLATPLIVQIANDPEGLAKIGNGVVGALQYAGDVLGYGAKMFKDALQPVGDLIDSYR